MNDDYFPRNLGTHIKAWQSGSIAERNKIWKDHLEKPMVTLTECSINVYKFKNDTYEEQWAYVMSSLWNALLSYKPHLCTQPFSYFNRVAKNSLTLLYNDATRRSRLVPTFDGEINKQIDDTQTTAPQPGSDQIDEIIEIVMNSPTPDLELRNAFITVLVNIQDVAFENLGAIIFYMKLLTNRPILEVTEHVRQTQLMLRRIINLKHFF